MTGVKLFNRTMLLATAPFLGMLIWMTVTTITLELSDEAFPKDGNTAPVQAGQYTNEVAKGLDTAAETAVQTAESLHTSISLYEKTTEEMNRVVRIAAAQAGRPAIIYDRRITSKLGAPADTVQSDKLRAQLFYVQAQNFKGYALKVKLKKAEGMAMVLGNDTFGGAETTLSAVNRYDAVAGITAGGFADQDGRRYPLSTTVMNGEYVNGFEPTFSDLFFVGINKSLKLVGGKYSSREELDKEEVLFGASFVPILLKNGVNQPIPKKWQNSPKRAPRTVIANYKDDQLLFLVTDGSDESGRSGASLAELQILLKRYGAVDAYNLDGGGSSTLIFKGKVINQPSDGQLRKLATHFIFFE
ncbi:phosphodiester glycosidase family protein [Paenibacillus tarimensis]